MKRPLDEWKAEGDDLFHKIQKVCDDRPLLAVLHALAMVVGSCCMDDDLFDDEIKFDDRAVKVLVAVKTILDAAYEDGELD